ncbi:oligopeptide transport system permease protein OppB [Paenibacillus sp. CCS19]|uniref:ABC transporter permease n=1 Tax=Paenibacillus sp. CCS19 TaxID=3158387 RepID=UPI00255FAA2B|nr:ABC transporter permease [Paenibacillus cellulosilyticus]GMK38956.1 oligopeptide transport system permease protein OppB [Paenibacillus cellulosilyticus]
MIRYLLKKLLYMVVSLFVLASATFFLMKIIPGNPFMSEKEIPKAIRAMLEAKYGLDKPLWSQYLTYINNLIHLDLGMSMKQQYTTVSSIIGTGFLYSLQLGIFAIILSVTAGIVLGIIAALNHRKFLDTFTIFLAVLGVSIPNFVVASGLQYFLGVKLRWFDVAGLNDITDYVMPTIALAVLPAAFIARLTRSSMLEVLTADYIKTARAKGMSGRIILYRHALRNAILPVVTYIGPMTANIITGSVIVEQIFGIGGLGKFFVNSITNRDYTLIMGLTLFYAVILMLARFATDIAYAFIDPRIKLNSRKEG